MYVKRLFLLIAFIWLYSGCTKEVPVKPEEKDWWKIDLTGYWNGYGYNDLSGRVPLEVIKITKTPYNEYVATKMVGDNAVPSGHITWHGYADTNPFKIDAYLGNGAEINEYKELTTINIVSENVLRSEGLFIVYIRRTDGYFP